MNASTVSPAIKSQVNQILENYRNTGHFGDKETTATLSDQEMENIEHLGRDVFQNYAAFDNTEDDKNPTVGLVHTHPPDSHEESQLSYVGSSLNGKAEFIRDQDNGKYWREDLDLGFNHISFVEVSYQQETGRILAENYQIDLSSEKPSTVTRQEWQLSDGRVAE